MRALIFDLDGTLVDTVYAHVFAWQQALAEAGMPIDGWRVHRRIGMSGGLFTRAIAREIGRALEPERQTRSSTGTERFTRICSRALGLFPARCLCSAACAIWAFHMALRRRAVGRRLTRRSRCSRSRPARW